VQKFEEKKLPNIFEKSQISSQAKKSRNICIKAQFKSLKLSHQTAFETLNYQQQKCFETS
jgi:hypothetical protein